MWRRGRLFVPSKTQLHPTRGLRSVEITRRVVDDDLPGLLVKSSKINQITLFVASLRSTGISPIFLMATCMTSVDFHQPLKLFNAVLIVSPSVVTSL